MASSQPSIDPTREKMQTVHLEESTSPIPSMGSQSGEGGSSVSSPEYTSAPPRIIDPGRPLWTHRLSASFNAVADQIAAASQAIAHIPPVADAHYVQFKAHIEEIAEKQTKIGAELEELRQQIRAVSEGPERFQKQLDDHIAEFKLEQQRLPARLHNACATVPKEAIKPVVGKSGKVPAQFPATRGEFEHLTKERYEGLMQAYGIPIAGDVAAKRNAVRSFIGLPQ